MRLNAGGVRELHWHKQAEWAYMLFGTARITAIDLSMPSLAYAARMAEYYCVAGIEFCQGDIREIVARADDGSANSA